MSVCRCLFELSVAGTVECNSIYRKFDLARGASFLAIFISRKLLSLLIVPRSHNSHVKGYPIGSTN